MDTVSTIRAFQGTLSNFVFKDVSTFPEAFAVKRFLKKFQVPDRKIDSALKAKGWNDWISYDLNLRRIQPRDFMKFPPLYRARLEIHDLLRNFRYGDVDFPKGSEVSPTFGHNSIEARLCKSKWTCTYDNFTEFAKVVYNHVSLKRAFRQRYYKWFRNQKFNISKKQADVYVYNECVKQFKDHRKATFEAFEWKLSRIVTLVQGSRFSTVPKNNEMRRPINVEPFGNIIVQRRIGNGLRSVLKNRLNIDLDTLSQTHRRKICESSVATIDLKNASDSISLTLCEFLLPKAFYSVLLNARSPWILGPDKGYYPIEKISSMGNGFTFELMTLILTVLARQFDNQASVFGDDIIIDNQHAESLITLLEGVGFQVNKEKSFISSPFRESCGGNYHDDFGYIESYDFKYPESIHDCIVIYNKTLRLSVKYDNFWRLRTALHRHIPKALHGIVEFDFFSREIEPTMSGMIPPEFCNFFRSHVFDDLRRSHDHRMRDKLEALTRRYHYKSEDVKFFWAFNHIEKLRTPTLSHLVPRLHYGKYAMYLHAGRRTKDPVSGRGTWTRCLMVSIAGSNSRWTNSHLL